MPRTKVSRNSKRNREAALREEKIREFDSTLDQYLNSLDMKIKQDISEIETEIGLMKSRIPQKLLAMKMADFTSTTLSSHSELKGTSSYVSLQATNSHSSKQSQTSMLSSAMKSRDDEGYLTEDSRASGIENGLAEMRTFKNTSHLQLQGPLSSAKASRKRRSRSACNYPGSALKAQPTVNSSHMSRPKMRTPMISRQKAISADRNLNINKELLSSPTALLRWPKPGEMVISMTGSPVVAQVMPGQYANVNIPIRDGVLSLQPKKLQNVDPELFHRIDQETLTQIKLLQSNLQLIMSYADKTENYSN